MKTQNIFLIVLLAAILTIVSFEGNLLPANVLGNSQIEMQLGVDSDVSSSYWVLTTAETKVSSTDFMTNTNGTQLAAGSTSETGTGVTADGESAEASIQAQYFYNLDDGNLGYTTHIAQYTTIPYINKVYLEKYGAFNLATRLVAEKSSTGVLYYEIKDETWTYNANYQPSVVITTNGISKTYTANKITETGNLYAVQGTNPTIFFKENAIASERNTNTPPSLSDYLAIVPYGNNQLLFVDTADKNMNEIITSWNKGAGNQYMDWNRNSKVDDLLKAGDSKTADLEDLCSEDSYRVLTNGMVQTSTFSVDTLKTHEYDKISDSTKYTIVNPSTLAYDTDLVILGTWYIPIEYGTVKMVQHVTVPVIGDVTLPNVYEDGTSRIEVPITNNGDTGKITVRLIGTNTSNVKINDWQQNINIESGDTEVVLFEITGIEVNGNSQNCLRVEAEGTTGEIVYKDLCFFVLDTDLESYKNSLQYVTITAVDKQGEELPDMAIEVFAQDSVQYGVWYGEVPVGELSVGGQKIYDYNPITTSIVIEEGKEDYKFVYEQLYTETSPVAAGSNTYMYLTIFLAIVIILMLIAGTFIYFKTSKKGTRRRK